MPVCESVNDRNTPTAYSGIRRNSLAEMIGYPVVYAVGREPVHARDVDTHPFHHTLAHVSPREIVVLVFGILLH